MPHLSDVDNKHACAFLFATRGQKDKIPFPEHRHSWRGWKYFCNTCSLLYRTCEAAGRCSKLCRMSLRSFTVLQDLTVSTRFRAWTLPSRDYDRLPRRFITKTRENRTKHKRATRLRSRDEHCQNNNKPHIGTARTGTRGRFILGFTRCVVVISVKLTPIYSRLVLHCLLRNKSIMYLFPAVDRYRHKRIDRSRSRWETRNMHDCTCLWNTSHSWGGSRNSSPLSVDPNTGSIEHQHVRYNSCTFCPFLYCCAANSYFLKRGA